MSPRLKKAFVMFAREISILDDGGQSAKERDARFHELIELATYNNEDGTIAPVLTNEEEQIIISMMVV